jgi:hypothetical protein
MVIQGKIVLMVFGRGYTIYLASIIWLYELTRAEMNYPHPKPS